jgi:hypothetical protein
MFPIKSICLVLLLFLCAFVLCLTPINAQDTIYINKDYDYITRYEAFEAMGITLGKAARCSPEGTITSEKKRVREWLQKNCRSQKEANDIYQAFLAGAKTGLESYIINLSKAVDAGKDVSETIKEFDEKCPEERTQYQRIVLIP